MAEEKNIVTATVAKVAMRLFIIPLLRQRLNKEYDTKRNPYNPYDRQCFMRLALESIRRTPAGVALFNFIKAAGYTIDSLVFEL